ncbi:MAG: glycosyltransferase family 39 protein [Methanosarcinaceae archaeon]|nr:glycosyltransferase family 39 protein [Methanosarcinaceae archaeon]MDD4497375.1 glycosyltransferase family 39 protein [Methanosarcinaceae archaeon]
MSQKPIIENLDVILSVTGMIGGLALILLYFISPTIHLISIGISLVFACLVYLLIRNKQTNFKISEYTRTEKLSFEILFFIIFIIMIYILHSSQIRPPLYFILFSVCSALLAISIFLVDTKLGEILQIIKIYLISFTAKYSIYNIAGVVPGVDSWIHAAMNLQLAQTGNIDVLWGKEVHFPIMHIQTAITQILTDTSIKEASNFAVIVPFVILSVCIYLFVQHIFGTKTGLMAMLIINLSDFHIVWGSAPQTTSFGVIFYYLILYTLLRRYFAQSREKWTFISLVFIFTLIYTHAVSSFIFLVTLSGLGGGSIIYEKLISKKIHEIPWIADTENKRLLSTFRPKEASLLGNITNITIIFLLQHWFTSLYSKGGNSFFDVIASTLIFYLTEYAGVLNRPESFSAYSTLLSPFIERYANTLGLSTLIFFAIIGGLFWFTPGYISKLKFSFMTCITTLLLITFIFPFLGIRNIIPSRWFVFEYFLLSIMAAFSINKIVETLKREDLKKIFLSFALFILVFFMISCNISNSDSPLWLKESTISTTYTLAEVRGGETLLSFSNVLCTDNGYGPSILGFNSEPVDSFAELKEGNLKKNQTIVWRNYMLDRPIHYFTELEGYYQPVEVNKILGPEFLAKLNKNNKIYQNGEVNGYI